MKAEVPEIQEKPKAETASAEDKGEDEEKKERRTKLNCVKNTWKKSFFSAQRRNVRHRSVCSV